MFGFWDYLQGLFSENIDDGVIVADDYFCTGFFRDNPLLVKVYKRFLYHAGHCPVCNDFLFIELIGQYGDGSFNVVKSCVNRDCDYTLDISSEFNIALGFKPKINEMVFTDENNFFWDVMSRDVFGGRCVPECTGVLKCSYDRLYEDDG